VTASISSEQLTPLEPLQEPAVDQLQRKQLAEPSESTHDSLEEPTIAQPQKLIVEQPTEEKEWECIDRLARKPKEHMRTWGSRLRQRWYEITGEKRDLPVTEKACKLYHKDLLQIDEEAYEKIQTEEKPAPDGTHFRAGEPSSLSVDELANWLAGPDNRSANPAPSLLAPMAEHSKGRRQAPQTDSEWYDLMEGEKIEGFHFVKKAYDPARPHRSLKHKAVWKSDVPSGYNFASYIPEVLADARPQITKVLERELYEKGQIKTAITILATYEDDKGREAQPYHRGEMHVLLSRNDIAEHITRSIGEIEEKHEDFLNKGSSWRLKSVNMITIEAYTYRRAVGGSYIPTPKALGNKKCTINLDNKGLIDPETGKLSEKCLKGALDAYFAHLDGHTKKLERIFRAEKFEPYLERVKLDGIPMPTPIDSHVFNKIEDLNPDICIHVWGWDKKEGKPEPVIASKNHNRRHIINLMALTDITKSDQGKYGQKNHFLWIKNPNALVYKDTAHHGKKHLCNKCFQSFPSPKSLDYHLEGCPGLGGTLQRVELPIKGENDFVQFENFGRMMYAPCVIFADFEANNKKCDENYGGSMRKIAEQRANSFCYKVHWIEDNKTWGHSYTEDQMQQKSSYASLMQN
jgi:hypothetical protein